MASAWRNELREISEEFQHPQVRLGCLAVLAACAVAAAAYWLQVWWLWVVPPVVVIRIVRGAWQLPGHFRRIRHELREREDLSARER